LLTVSQIGYGQKKKHENNSRVQYWWPAMT
jgi:hypothetical protein